ncbi:PAS domain-containing protein [Nocardioides sp.]|uniref:PAS domain-containing protein n=1 Tax=Nocardioides sp. TaxID=35761 RepID=UPI0035AF164D
MIPEHVVARVRSAPWFGDRWSPYALLDDDLRIRASNAAFSRATGVPAERLVGQVAVDVFPADPSDPAASSLAAFCAGIEDVLRTGRPCWLGPVRHDTPHPHDRGAFVLKVWLPVQLPVTHDGQVVAVLHHVQDLTAALGGTTAAPQHTAAMDAAVRHLHREFPQAPAERVLGLVTDSYRTVLRALGVAELDQAVSLARLRLEIHTGGPARPLERG